MHTMRLTGSKKTTWIITALSFMKGVVALWTTNYQANFNEGKPIFNNNWDDFVTEFWQNFKAEDQKQYAQACLDNLWQKGQTVKQYTAKFRLYALCTKLGMRHSTSTTMTILQSQ
jgi:hypothetical protein